jgi:TetR/AcrR family transcriptional regulator
MSPTGDLPIIKHVFNTPHMPKSRTPKRRPSPALRRPGRPATDNSADIKAALLQAARALFLKHGFANVSSRQIAAAARTTPAMIHYYFEDKHGLFREIVAQAMAPFVTTLSDALVEGATKPLEPAALLNAHLRTGAANPWLASLLVNEVLAEGGELHS